MNFARDIFGIRNHSFVNVNGLWIAPKEINLRLWQHLGELLSVDSLHVTSVVGACALLALDGHYFAVSTFHQILDRDPNWIGLNCVDDRTIQTSGSLWTAPAEDRNTDLSGDLAIFDFTEPVRAGELKSSIFFDIGGSGCIQHRDEILSLQIFGLIDSDQTFNIETDEGLPSGYRVSEIKLRVRTH